MSSEHETQWLMFWNQAWLYADESWLAELGNSVKNKETSDVQLMRYSPFETRKVLGIEDAVPPKPGEALLQWLRMDITRCQYCLLLACDVVLKERIDVLNENVGHILLGTEMHELSDGIDKTAASLEPHTVQESDEEKDAATENIIHSAMQNQSESLSYDARRWARHIAKALMPGTWNIESLKPLSASQIGLLLLKAWLSPPTWQRVQLRHSKSLVLSIESVPTPEIPIHRLNQLWYGVIWRSQVEGDQP
ncbi:hypothetical protein GV054_05375 [Marinomonas mediterranea]|uniref:hypothetical protein n=1 Tax=Marinomonas mediterranea TaxID=119864 RepID=UPI00234B2838|nr:hypothetical protein [Marinomonas mediterranea]WCN12473.1 hypothetical protein GV054_05375 [Marinomonas mediterranea]